MRGYATAVIILFVAAVLIWLAVVGYRRGRSRALDQLVYSRALSTDGVFVGETLTLTETFQNPTWFPIFGLKLEFYLPGGITVDGLYIREYTKITSVFSIPPYSTVTKKHDVRVDRRGRFFMREAQFSYRSVDYVYEIPLEMYGYPDYFGVDTRMPADIFKSGESASDRRFIDDPFFISGIREYRVGDPMRSINFKASVRSMSHGARSLMCNSYESSRCYDTMIFLDLNRYFEVSTHSEAQLEEGLKYACFLFREAISNGGRVGFAANVADGSQSFVFIPCEGGEAHIKRMLMQFAVLDVFSKREYSMSALIGGCIHRVKRESDIYLLTPFVDESTAETLSTLERAGRSLRVITLSGGGNA